MKPASRSPVAALTRTGPLAAFAALVLMAVVVVIAFPTKTYAQTPSDDATLSGLTVSPRDIIGFTANRTAYEVGVASDVTQATINATKSDSGAAVAYSGTDADANTAGHQVVLSAGRNRVTVTVTTADTVTTATYTVSVNRGVTDVYGWKAVDDLDGLLEAGNHDPTGIWSDGTTVWVADTSNDKIYAYNTDGTRDSDKDFDTLLAAGNADPYGLWSDGETMWVADYTDDKIYAYNTDGTRDETKDFDTLRVAGNRDPIGLWSDGDTMWVADTIDNKVYAYRISDQARDSDKDFDTLDAGNPAPTGIWSDGATMWVANFTNDKIYAYQMSDKARDGERDFDTLIAAGNEQPTGIWSDGATMWVSDYADDKVYSYNMPPPSADARLSGLTVSPRDIIGFTANRTAYEVGVASDVTRATITATANNSGAAVVFSGTDADANAAGHQVALSAGRNEVTVTVTATDGATTKTYTVRVNRGVIADYGWKAVDDLDGLLAAGNADSRGIWSNGTTMWVADFRDGNIYAYNTDGTRDNTKDFDTLSAAGNGSPRGLWSDGETMWVADGSDDKIYAYKISDQARDSGKDFNTLDAAGNGNASGIWSNGTTMWVADSADNKIYAYNTDGTRDNTKDFDTLDAAGNNAPYGIWSDDTTMWVADVIDDKIYAYQMPDHARDGGRDFNTLDAAGNESPYGLWSDGTTMWVADLTDDKVYSYNMPPPLSSDATLSGLTVSPRDIIGFTADRRAYEVGVASDVTQATITATASDSGAAVAYSGTDADLNTAGYQVALTAGRNEVTVTVTAADGVTTATYTVSVNQGVTTVYGWKAVDDLDGLIAAGNTVPYGIWSDGATVWVVDDTDGKIYAYNTDGTRDDTKDFDTLDTAGNNKPRGIWSNGDTMWVADSTDHKIYAYNTDGTRDDTKDFDTLDAAGNTSPFGLWSDGDTMWVADSTDDKIYAYKISDRDRDSDKDFDTLIDAGNESPTGIWSDGETMWVADSTDDKIYAYRVSDKADDSDKDFDTLHAAGNTTPRGIWSDGETMWVADSTDDKIYSYNMPPPPSADATLSGLTVSPRDIIGFTAGRSAYEVGVASDVPQATITATAGNASAVMAYSGTDADANTAGHQVALSAGRNEVTITVTATDGVTTATYTVSVNQGVTADYGWKAVDDLDGLIAAGNDDPIGVWSDGATMWVVDDADDKIYAYNTDGTRDSDKDLDTLIGAGNGSPVGIWSNGDTMWVADNSDDKIYAYKISDQARDSGKDFDTLDAAGNNDPRGIWSDGATMWVADSDDHKIYAYKISDQAHDEDRDFDTLIDAGNNSPTGIWSDGETMWVANATDDKIFAYRVSDQARDGDRDFDTLSAAGNTSPSGIWSNGETMWVADEDDVKVYSYNMPAGAPSSDDATLSGLTVSPRDIIGFTAERTAYEVGVASTVTQATFTATANDSGAAVEYSGTDADATTAGHQVNLSAGANFVTVTVTAEDGGTKEYTVRVNRGVTDDYGWKAVDDLDGLKVAGNNSPYGIWSDETTVWVADWDDRKLYAYRLSDGTRDASRDIALSADNNNPSGIWSDGTTMWVADDGDNKLHAYHLSDGTRDADRDFALGGDNTNPSGIWSDGTTMWVADSADDKLYVYRWPDGARDADSDFALSADSDNPRGIWLDGTTLWVADFTDGKLYAYQRSDGTRDPDRDFDTLDAATNRTPRGIWSDGATMWVAGWGNKKVYSYNMPPSDDAKLSGLTVSPRDIIGFEADRTAYEVGVASDVTQATITATASDSGAAVVFSGTDADANTAGHQVALSAGANEVTITVTAADSVTTKTYTVSVNQGVTDVYGWKAVDDLDGLKAAGNGNPFGIWSNGDTMWVSDFTDDKIYAYNTDGTRDSDKDFNTLSTAGNGNPFGIWSNGDTMWVADNTDDKIYAYKMSDKSRDSGKDFDTLAEAGNDNPYGIWSNGDTMWVADNSDDKIYAYKISDQARDSGKDFDTLDAAGNNDPRGIWSDGTTMWVADGSEVKIYAYNTDGTRDSGRDFDTLSAAGNRGPYGLWSDGETMWVADWEDGKIYSYNMPAPPPSSDDATLSGLTVSPRDITGFTADRTVYEVGLASTVAQATINATASDSGAAVAYSGTDADANTAGHQVVLSAGRNEVTITVTATDTTTTKTYTVGVNQGVTDVYGWKAVDDLDGLILAGNDDPIGVWSGGATIWVSDFTDRKIYAYNTDGTRDSDKDFDTLSAAGNTDPVGIWSNGDTMWVADNTDNKIYAYKMSDKSHDSDKDFDTLSAAGNTDPVGIWSNGDTMWVADNTDNKIYAYRMSDKSHDSDKDFDTLSGAGNTRARGIWSDGTTMWVADAAADKIYAYRVSDKEPDGDKDFDTLIAAGNADPRGIWSDGTTMWVSDLTDDKVYSYNMPPPPPASDDEDQIVAGICNRTPAVRNAILHRLIRISDCALVTDTHLARLIGQLSIGDQTGLSLKSGDFSGLSNLKHLYLMNNDLTTLPEDVFDGLDGLESLWLSSSDIEVLPADVFDGLGNLQALYLHNNQIGSLPENVFEGLVNLQALFLDNNQIESLPPDVFDGLGNLHTLYLHRNLLSTLPEDVFDGLGNLHTLYLHRNLLSALPEDVFDGLGKLHALYLHGNQIASLPPDVFDGLGKLHALYLHNNLLNTLPEDVFDGLGNLKVLLLNDNQLSALPADVFDGISNLTSLYLGWNELASLPDGVFEGMVKLNELRLEHNPGAPFVFSADLEQKSQNWFVVKVAQGAPFTISVILWVTVELDDDDNPITETKYAWVEAGSVSSRSLYVSGLGVKVLVAVFGQTRQTGNYGDLEHGYHIGRGEDLTFQSMLIRSPQPTIRVSGAAGTRNAEDGSVQVGDTLTADTSGIVDADGLDQATFSYQWIRNNGSSDADIKGATDSTYTVVAADEGNTIKVQVSFTDDAGNRETRTSAATEAVSFAVQQQTANRAATGEPTITGTARVGEMLTADTSGIADQDGLTNVSYVYQWVANDGTSDTDITGATDSTYTLTDAEEGKALRVRVSFTDDAGNDESLTSAATAAVAAKPNSPATGAPTITGTAQVGETLRADTSAIEDADGLDDATFGYQWQVDDTDITGATDPTYTLAEAEEGRTVTVRVSFTDDADNGETLTSEPTSEVAAAEPEQPPSKPRGLTGTAAHNEVSLTWTDPGDAGITGYQILRRNRDLDAQGQFQVHVDDTGTADTSYVDTDVAPETRYGYRIKARNSGGLSKRSDYFNADTPPKPNHPATGAPTISGTARVGETLRADTSGIADADGLDNAVFGYQWRAAAADIPGATNSTYILTDADEGKAVTVQVSFTDDAGNSERLTSAATEVVEAEPEPQEPPATPQGLTGTVDHDEVSLTWTDPSDAGITGYQILRRNRDVDAPGQFQVHVDDTGSAATSYVDGEVEADTRYVYRIKAINEAGLSPQSDYFRADTPPAPNRPATGAPTISGTARVGETLRADTSGIADADGLSGATFSYQWIATDGGRDLDIEGATAATYTLLSIDKALRFMVRVSFTDDGGNEETLTSAETAAVAKQ